MKPNETLQKSKQGVNLVRNIIDNNNCFFHQIQQENDVGIDAIIEFSDNGIMIGNSIAVQIKTGTSYINHHKKSCSFPIDDHLDYWVSHMLPVYGFVCDIEKQCYYYVNIKNYIHAYSDELHNANIKSITFEIAYYNTITSENFENLFKKPLFGKVPILSIDVAEALIKSDSVNDIDLGLYVLRKYYYHIEKTWDIFLSVFRDDEYSFFHEKIIDFFAYGTHNPDIWKTGNDLDICLKWVKDKTNNFAKQDVIKLLEFVDEENGFHRGSMGEWIDFIIQVIPDNIEILTDIASDKELSLFVRENALFLVACYNTQVFLHLPLKIELPKYKPLEEEVLKYGAIYPYM